MVEDFGGSRKSSLRYRGERSFRESILPLGRAHCGPVNVRLRVTCEGLAHCKGRRRVASTGLFLHRVKADTENGSDLTFPLPQGRQEASLGGFAAAYHLAPAPTLWGQIFKVDVLRVRTVNDSRRLISYTHESLGRRWKGGGRRPSTEGAWERGSTTELPQGQCQPTANRKRRGSCWLEELPTAPHKLSWPSYSYNSV